MRNTKAFKEAAADTLAEPAHLGLTVRPGTVADTIERNIRNVAERLGMQERSAWRYFGPAGLAASIAQQRQRAERSSTPGRGDVVTGLVGQLLAGPGVCVAAA
ncbi:hypothetical protein [Streptomyces sp. NPDC002990]